MGKNILFRTDVDLNRIVLAETLKYKNITVPAGYVSDGLTKLLNKYQPYCLRAAVVHDYCCEVKPVPRKIGDQYFLEIMEEDGVPYFKRLRFYYAVRAYAIAMGKK